MRRIVLSKPSPAVVVAFVALFIAAGGVALASIPDGSGLVHACYQRNGGSERIIDTSKRGGAGRCRSGEKALSWNQQGPSGFQGPPEPRAHPEPREARVLQAPPEPLEPRGRAWLGAWAHVLGDGTVDSGHNVTSANVTHPFTSGYCFIGLGFTPHVAVVAQVHLGGNFGANNCPAGVQLIVHEQIASGTPAPFSIIFE